MTDKNLEDELRATLAAVADSYVPTSATPEPKGTRLPVVPLIVAAAAVLLVIAGLATMLTDDDAAVVDTSNPPTPTEPAPAVPTTDATEPSTSDEPDDMAPPLTAPDAGPQPADLADVARSVWVLYGIEQDGERLNDDAAGTITATIETTGASSYRLTGWAGCDYAADVRSEGAQLVWAAPVDDCDGDASPFAQAFRASLTEASSASTVDQWPTPFLHLDGDGVRLLFVPATDNTVPGPVPTTDAVPVTTTPAPASTTGWTLTEPPYAVLDASITVDTGTELITIGHVPGDPGFPGTIVGHGFNPTLGLWREITPQQAMMNNRLDRAIWTGSALAAYLDGSGVSELVTYDPGTDAWTWVAGWDFTRSYPLTVMEMREGELYLQSGNTLLTWREDGGGHWTIIQDPGDPTTPHAAVRAEVETLWARIGDLNVEQPEWPRMTSSANWVTRTISYRIDPAFYPADSPGMVAFVAAARDATAAFIVERNLTDTIDDLLVITFDYDSDPSTE